jgi:hypothetical protein
MPHTDSKVEYYFDLADALKKAKELGQDARILALQYNGNKPDWEGAKTEGYESHITMTWHPGGNHAVWHQTGEGEGFWEWLGPDFWDKDDWYGGARRKHVTHAKHLPRQESDEEHDNGIKTFTAYGVICVPEHRWRPPVKGTLKPTEGPKWKE